MAGGHAIVSSSNFILLTLLFTLYLQKAFGCENATTRLDCFKLNSTIDDSLNDFGGESRLTCGLNQRHIGYASWRQNKLVKKRKLKRKRRKYMKQRINYY